MRIVIVLVILVLIGAALDWVSDARKRETKRLAEKPRSEKYIVGNLDRGKAGGAAIMVHQYKQAFMYYKLAKQKNPDNLKELVDSGHMQPGSERDAFGQEYELNYEGREAVISSPGADRVRGTPDDLTARFVVD